MAKCLRCGAENEWIQGYVPSEPVDDSLEQPHADLKRENARLRKVLEKIKDTKLEHHTCKDAIMQHMAREALTKDGQT